MLKNIKIRYKLIVSFLLTTLISVSAIIIFLTFYFSNDIKQRAIQNMEKNLQVSELIYKTKMEEVGNFAQSIAKNRSLQLSMYYNQNINDAASALAKENKKYSIFIADSKGKIITSVNKNGQIILSIDRSGQLIKNKGLEDSLFSNLKNTDGLYKNAIFDKAIENGENKKTEPIKVNELLPTKKGSSNIISITSAVPILYEEKYFIGVVLIRYIINENEEIVKNINRLLNVNAYIYQDSNAISYNKEEKTNIDQTLYKNIMENESLNKINMEYGGMISNYKTLYNINGKPIGAFGISISVDSFLKTRDYAILTTILITIAGIIIALIIGLVIARNISVPINRLMKAVDRISTGDYSYEIKRYSNDEIGKLSTAFNKMSNELQSSFLKIEKQNKEIKKYSEHLEEMVEKRTKELKLANDELKDMNIKMLEDLHMAQKVQLGLIPDQKSLPKLKKLQFGTKYLAMESIGGDLYDVINLGNGQYAFFIADVSGHGVPAALISTMVKVAFNSYAITGNDPADVCKNVNERMCQFIENLDYDLTAFYGVIDTTNKQIQFTNAAHHPAYIYRNSTKDIIVLQELNGYIGLVQDLNFTSKTEVIQDGDKIILFTDGVIEAENDKGDIYDMNRFESYIRKFGHLPAESFVAGLVSDVDKFCGSEPKKDDIAILCMDYYSE